MIALHSWLAQGRTDPMPFRSVLPSPLLIILKPILLLGRQFPQLMLLIMYSNKGNTMLELLVIVIVVSIAIPLVGLAWMFVDMFKPTK